MRHEPPAPYLPLPGLTPYGELPGHFPFSETSREAAVAIAPQLNDLQAEVLELIRKAGDRGRTVHELVDITGRMKDSIAPRVTELKLLAQIVPCGKRAAPGHRAATAWRIR